MGIAEYNGYGFIYCGIYRTPRFWRKSKRKERFKMHPEIYMNETTKVSVIDHRETCHHFINYEIYDCLTDDLKEKYIDQFKPFELTINSLENGEVEFKIMCFANHHDCISKYRVDCSESYKETLNSLRIDLQKKGLIK